MKTAIALLLASATVSHGQFAFEAGFTTTGPEEARIGLIDEGPGINGTWSGDITQNAGFQTIGQLDNADGTGFARSPLLAPVDVTAGQGNFLGHHAYVELTIMRGSAGSSTLNLTLHDSDGGSSSWTPTPAASVGVFTKKFASEVDFSGNLNWTKVNRFSFAGVDGANPVEFSLDKLIVSPVPEPGMTAVVTGLMVAGFAVWRRRAKIGAQ